MPTQNHLVLEPGGGERLRFLDDSTLLLKTVGEQPDSGALAFYEYIAAPAAKGSPQHIHHAHDETFYVVDGNFEFALVVCRAFGVVVTLLSGVPRLARSSARTRRVICQTDH